MNNLTYVRQYVNINQRAAIASFMDTLYRFNICRMTYTYRYGRRLWVVIDEQ